MLFFGVEIEVHRYAPRALKEILLCCCKMDRVYLNIIFKQWFKSVFTDS